MFDFLKTHRLSLAILAGFAPVTAHIAMALWAPNQSWRERTFYGFKEFAKCFTTVNLQEPANWTHPNHPHVEFIWPFYTASDSTSTPASRWGAVVAHNIGLTYAPIVSGWLIHKLADHVGLNEALEEHGIPFDI